MYRTDVKEIENIVENKLRYMDDRMRGHNWYLIGFLNSEIRKNFEGKNLWRDEWEFSELKNDMMSLQSETGPLQVLMKDK